MRGSELREVRVEGFRVYIGFRVEGFRVYIGFRV